MDIGGSGTGNSAWVVWWTAEEEVVGGRARDSETVSMADVVGGGEREGAAWA